MKGRPVTRSADTAPATLGRVVIVTGNYGSGKTEVSVNWAIALAAANARAADPDKAKPISIVDLDIANPYFRCREAADVMRGYGVDVVVPPGELMHADLPIILPRIKGLIQQSEGQVILDVGGDDVGARVLASFAGAFGEHEMLQVVNGFRPFTDTVEGCLQIMDEIQAASRLAMSGIISNAHLMDETTVETILEGAALAQKVAHAREIPLRFVTAPAALAGEVEAGLPKGVTVLPIDRHMLPPWLGAAEGEQNISQTTQSRRGQDRFGLLTEKARQGS